MRLDRDLCRNRMVRPEYANHHGLRSRQQNRRRGARRVADASDFRVRVRRGAGFRDSRNPAAQRIHLFQVLMNNPASYLPRLLCAAALVILLAVTLTFVVDPLQLFRPARLFAAMYSPESRLQAAGLIRSQEFDTVFMGTSLALHYRQSDIDRHLGVRSVKLVLPGSMSSEQKFVLDAALERRPKRI